MDRSDLEKVAARVKKHEGFRPHPYEDTAGKLSIGYGRNLTDDGITRTEADHLLSNDLTYALDELQKYHWFDALAPARQGALLDMMVNLGATHFAKFTNLIGAVERGQFELAAREMLWSNWAAQVGSRAKKDAEQMRTGEWGLSA